MTVPLPVHALWLYRLLWPSFCMHCDKAVRRSHYRRCNCAARRETIAAFLNHSGTHWPEGWPSWKDRDD